jgi:predicted enzyme related to lactoylglutathione lyase
MARRHSSLIKQAKKGKNTMSNADSRGKFVWHELLTADTAGAGAFYPKVVSWKSQPWDKDPSYTLWMTKAGPIGGVANLEDGNGRWLAYVGVEDVHAAVAQAKSMGAKVIKDVTDMPGTGTYAVLTDPQGGEFAVYKSHNPGGNGGAPGVGEFSWHELATSDPDGAVSFYSKLFGWGVGPKHDMGPEFGTYHLMLHGGEQFVGIFKSPNVPTGWMCYVRVDDAGKAANAAKGAGGRVINGPMEVPGGDWIAQVLDPAGVMFAVHERKSGAAAAAQPDAAAKPAAKPKAPKAAKPAAAPAAAEPAEAAKPSAKPAEAAKPAAKPAEAAKPAAASKPSAAPKPAAAAKPAAAPAKSAAAPAKSAAAASSRPAAKKAAAKKGAAKKTKAAAKKAPAKKAAAKKAPAKKAGKKVAKKAPAKKAAKKAAPKAKKKAKSKK